MDSVSPRTVHKKPNFAELRELQRSFLQLRWEAICARGDQAFYSRSINTHVVTHALGHIEGAEALGARTTEARTKVRHNLPSHAAAASPLLSSAFLFVDAVTCCLLTRHRKFSDFGDGMISYNSKQGKVEFYPESVRSYRSRRLMIALALIYVWLFLCLIAFWIYRDATGTYQNLEVPPYGSGSIHLFFCLSVVLAYVLGSTVVPRHTTVGLREGALPSLVSGGG